ncbi:carotenoid oxygenase family protein [Rugosimonospora acidiphila]|uniref:Dioxygenase n=1 Tax=Rugosimonospora acidiphila TaxID=556531 RepID=A0ABP9SQR4_9ACTN
MTSEAGAEAEPAQTDHRLGFLSLERELPAVDLPVEGSFPAWLSGSLIRVGPAKFEVGTHRYRHWFDGLAMLHRFSFSAGTVSYRNRFVDSPAYRAARDTGRIAYSEFATDPCRSMFRRFVTVFRTPVNGRNTNVNVDRFGDEFLAMSETPLPVMFDPQTLSTLGVGEPAPGQLTVAHPHRLPGSTELISYATHLSAATHYQLYGRAVGDTHQRMIATLPAPRPSYMHSFAVADHFAVLVEFPLVTVPMTIPLSGRPFIENYRWRPERGTRFLVVDLETGRFEGGYRTEPFFAFHHINAFARDGDLVIDVCAYDNADIVRALYLDRLRAEDARVPEATPRRYVLPAGGGEVRTERLGELTMELPRIDYDRRNGRPYRFVYGVGSREPGDFPNQLVKTDVERRESAAWSRPGTYPGEPVFVRTPGDEREDGGVLLSIVLDPSAGTSFLLVLDAAELTEVARAWVPHRIPFGLHGQHFPAVSAPND